MMSNNLWPQTEMAQYRQKIELILARFCSYAYIVQRKYYDRIIATAGTLEWPTHLEANVTIFILVLSIFHMKQETIRSEPISRLFRDKNFGFLATVMDDGSPQVTPVWVDIDGDNIILNTAEGRLKHKNISRDPRVAVSVADHSNPYKMVTVQGTV